MGDAVEVPGNMHGTVKFVGQVDGKKGTFAGVQLAPEYAARGKNSGEVDGKSYSEQQSLALAFSCRSRKQYAKRLQVLHRPHPWDNPPMAQGRLLLSCPNPTSASLSDQVSGLQVLP